MIDGKDVTKAIGTAIELADDRIDLINEGNLSAASKRFRTHLELVSKVLNEIRRDMPESFMDHVLTELAGDLLDEPPELSEREEKLIHEFPDPNDFNGRTYEDED